MNALRGDDRRGPFNPWLLAIHLVVAGVVVAFAGDGVWHHFRASRVMYTPGLALLATEIVMMFLWGLYYATQFSVVRRTLHWVLWSHAILGIPVAASSWLAVH